MEHVTEYPTNRHASTMEMYLHKQARGERPGTEVCAQKRLSARPAHVSGAPAFPGPPLLGSLLHRGAVAHHGAGHGEDA
jgi:hypothetical protein